jgi:AcrR family transcriptional regulator
MELVTNTDERLKILQFTQQKFFAGGFYKTTMDEIARGMFISKNTIYKYFPNKNKLVSEVFSNFIESVKLQVGKIMVTDDNAVQKFVNLIHIISSYLMPLNDKLFKDMQVHAPQVWVMIDEARKRLMTERLGKLMEQGKKEELFADYPTDIMLTVFISSLRSVVNPDFLLHTNLSKQEALKYTFRILLGGILTKKGLQIFKKLKLPQ